ncbi:histidine kinase dimerization/phospho-acceptor domain-containing protein [Sphingomonas sp. CJ20]
MRFDDTLETVLTGDLETPFGVQSAWRQLVDLIGRRRAAPDMRAMATLRAIRDQVPMDVRAASARALEYADPPGPLVRLFARDDMRVALPVLRSARMTSSEWTELLPDLSPSARAILRHRRDLGPVVKRALDSFGPVDFVLSDDRPAEAVSEPAPAPGFARDALPWTHKPLPAEWATILRETQAQLSAPIHGGHAGLPADAPAPAPSTVPPIDAPAAEDLSFLALVGSPAPAPAEAETVEGPVAEPIIERPATPQRDGADPIVAEAPEATRTAVADEGGTFEIAEVVARIDAFWRHREEGGPPPLREALPGADSFRFETDAQGVVRWVQGVSRTPIVGLSLDLQGLASGSRVDGIAAGAFRMRAAFSSARMVIEGDSDAAGDWLLSGVPAFDSANGRFTGYRGSARRPRVDERAEPVRAAPTTTPAESLRQLVHELRTPTNAIAGFAEMIETQMLGPVSDPYRDRANVIRTQAKELLGAIDDLDLAARIDSAALALFPGYVELRPMLAAIADDLAPLCELRGAIIALPVDDLAVTGDRRAVERLLARLLATLVSACSPGERIGIHVATESGDKVAIAIDRPRALADYPGDSVLGIDDEREDATLLGTGFALRLARNLARELGGSLVIEPQTLTLRLPGAVGAHVGQAHLS